MALSSAAPTGRIGTVKLRLVSPFPSGRVASEPHWSSAAPAAPHLDIPGPAYYFHITYAIVS